MKLSGGSTPKRMRFHPNQGQYGMSGMGEISGRAYNYYQGVSPGMSDPGSSLYQMNWQPPLPPGPPSLLFNPAQPPPPLMPPTPAPPPPPDPPMGQSPKQRKPTKPSDDEPKSKSRKKTMSSRYARREWNREDAEKVLAVESEETPADPARMLLIKFPDPKISKEIVQGYSSAIETVHFQQPVTPRYCFAKLHPDADVAATIEELSKISFGGGTISAELKHEEERVACQPEEVDPYSLYVGNLPQKVTVAAVKEIFPTADQVDVGFSQRMKFTRYAFIRYGSVEAAIEAFRRTRNLVFESRSLIVRFYRHRASTGMPGEPRMPLVKKTPTAVPENKAIEKDTQVPPEVNHVAEEVKPTNESSDTESTETLDSKANVLAEAARLTEQLTPPETPSVDSQVTVKTEDGPKGSVVGHIKSEPLDQDLDDILYDKLIKAQSDMEQLEGEDCDEEDDEDEFEEMSEEETNDEDALRYGKNHWDILRKEEENRKEIKHQPDAITETAALSNLPLADGQLDRLVSLFSSDFGDYSEPNDPEVDDLFNELNPNDLDEEFSVFGS